MAAPAGRASSHHVARLHRALESEREMQASALDMRGVGSTRLCKGTHASAHVPAPCAVPRCPYAAEANLPRPRASPCRAAPSRAAPTHRAPPRSRKGKGATNNNKAVTAFAVEGAAESEGAGGGSDSSGGEGKGEAPVPVPTDAPVRPARRPAPLRVSSSAPVLTRPRSRPAGVAPAAHGTRGGPAAAWLAAHQKYLPPPGSCQSALRMPPNRPPAPGSPSRLQLAARRARRPPGPAHPRPQR